MAAKELKERKEGGNERKGLCPQNTQMDADEAGFIPIGVNARALAVADAAEHVFHFREGLRFKKFPGQGFGLLCLGCPLPQRKPQCECSCLQSQAMKIDRCWLLGESSERCRKKL